MTRVAFSLTIAIVLGIMLLGLAAADGARAGGIEPFLARLAESGAPKAAERISPLFVWDTGEAAHGRARIWLQRDPDVSWDGLRAALARTSPEAVWETDAGEFAQLVVPWKDLTRIAEIPGVFYLLRPPRGVPTVESEGLSSIGVPAFRARGYGGEGARVAVLDLGFKDYQALLGTELPSKVHARSFFRSPSGNGDIAGENEDHGTACAEIVADVAPDAEIYLVNVESPLDLQSAVDWLAKEKVSVISHSVGWYFGGLDGTGPIDDIADGAARRGMLWVNAAGNEAERHTWARAADADSDGLLEFDGEGDERLDFTLAPGEELALALLWDSWPTSTNLDMALEVVDGSDNVVATSDLEYAGYPYAFRYVDIAVGGPTALAARVRLKRGVLTDRTVHVFRIGSGTRMQDHSRPDRSLLAPADSPNVLTVGAVDYSTELLDSYSSRGDYDEGPQKPEICGPVGVSTATYGRFGFRGTSAAAPHVAGTAALLTSAGLRGGIADLNLSRDEVRSLLRDHAKPAPSITPLAWGILRLPTTTSGVTLAGPILLGNPARGTARWAPGCGEVNVIDATGRTVAQVMADRWDGHDGSGRMLPAGIYWLRCRTGGVSRLIWLGGE
jgi:subtilisin family serine protease